MIWTGLVMMDLVILVLLLVLFLLLLLVIITVRYTPIGYSAGIQVHGGHNKALTVKEKEWWHMDEVFFFSSKT